MFDGDLIFLAWPFFIINLFIFLEPIEIDRITVNAKTCKKQP